MGRKNGDFRNCNNCGKSKYYPLRLLNKAKYHCCSRQCWARVRERVIDSRVPSACMGCGKITLKRPTYLKSVLYPACSNACLGTIRSKYHHRFKNRPKIHSLNLVEKFFWTKLANVRKRAILKSFEYNLDYSFMVDLYNKQNKNCIYTGYPLNLDGLGSGIGKTPFDALSIDRIDSSKGYTKDNIVLCIHAINLCKLNYSVDTLQSILTSVYNNEHKKKQSLLEKK